MSESQRVQSDKAERESCSQKLRHPILQSDDDSTSTCPRSTLPGVFSAVSRVQRP